MCADEFLAARRALRIIDFSAVYYLKTIISPNDTDTPGASVDGRGETAFVLFSSLLLQNLKQTSRESMSKICKKVKKRKKCQAVSSSFMLRAFYISIFHAIYVRQSRFSTIVRRKSLDEIDSRKE